MKRRTYLTTIGGTVTGLSISVAGCSVSPGGGAEEEETEIVETEAEQTEAEATEVEETEVGETEVGETEVGTETEAGAIETETETQAGETVVGTGTAPGATNDIRMITDGSEYYFDPVGLFVEPGEEITWINEKGSHSSTAYAETLDAANTTRIPPEAEAWNSGILTGSGDEFTHTFEVKGTYDYFCIPHKQLGMVGRLVVGEPGGPAEKGQSPHGELPAPERIVEEKVIGWDEFDAE